MIGILNFSLKETNKTLYIINKKNVSLKVIEDMGILVSKFNVED